MISIAPPKPYSGPWGCIASDIAARICSLTEFLGAPQVAGELTKDLGQYFAIVDVMHKRYPVGSPNQTYLQALFAIIRQHAIGPEDIAEIEIHLPQRSVQRVPTTRHASISGEVVCAIAAAHGKLDFYTLHDGSAVQDAQVAQMRQRIRLVGRDDWQDLEHGRHAIVVLCRKDGARFEQEVWHEPMTGAELEEKFDALVGPKWGEAKTRRLKEQIRDLENAASMRPLLRELQG